MRWLGILALCAWGCDDGMSDDPVEDAAVVVPDSATPDAAPDREADGGHDGDAAATPDSAPDVGLDAAPPPNWAEMAPPATEEIQPGVMREAVEFEGAAPPPNPVTGTETPAALNRIRYTRYYAEGATEPRAIVVAMPGILAGASSMDPLARALVARATEAERPIEVWAVDRRGNGLEDLRGANTAEVVGDPEIAAQYYFGNATIDNTPFAGFVPQSDVDYMSEWGLALHVNDVRQMVQRVPRELRRGHVFLMGHSLGGMFAETYGGWTFEDGTRGSEELAGFILLDGAQAANAVSEDEWHTGVGRGIFSQPGVDAMRASGPRYLEIPLIGVKVYVLAEIMALRILDDPGGIVEDLERDRMIGLLSSRPPNDVPALTNAAALGLGFGYDYNPLSFARLRSGEVDGPTETFRNILGEDALRPSDPDHTYGWIDALDADPPGFTPIVLFSEALTAGLTNFAEWYFPTRLSVDLAAAGGVAVGPDSWQFRAGIRATAGALNDAPILSVAGDLFRVPQMSGVVLRVAPTIGEGRPAAGATREDADGWTLIDATFMAHLDITLAADIPANPVPGAVDAFIERHTEAGNIPGL